MEISRIDKSSVYYVSSDGKTFETKEECAEWEKKKKEEKTIKKLKKLMKKVKKICKNTKCAECPLYDEKKLDCLLYMYPDEW